MGTFTSKNQNMWFSESEDMHGFKKLISLLCHVELRDVFKKHLTQQLTRVRLTTGST